MSAINKWIVGAIYKAVWSHQNLDFLGDHFAADYLGHAETQIEGVNGMRNRAAALLRALPDGVFWIEDQIAEGDRVVTRWRARGVLIDDFAGISPTNRLVTLTGIDIFRIAHGKIIEGWSAINRQEAMPATADQEQDR